MTIWIGEDSDSPVTLFESFFKPLLEDVTQPNGN